MTTSMDIAVCFDCSLLVSFYKPAIQQIIRFLIRHASSCNEDDIRMALIEFQSHTDDWLTRTRPFTSSMNQYRTWINNVQTEGVTHKECKPIASVLDACLTLNWRSDTNLDRYHEKLVILFTDGPPCNLLNNECYDEENDVWKIADEFDEQNITLVIVGLGPSVMISDDFYCALTRKTGGEYIPLINAQRVLSSIVEKAIFKQMTLSALFRGLDMHADIEANSLYDHSSIKSRVSFMSKYCHSMKDIRKWLYSYNRSSKEVEFYLSDIDDNESSFACGGPPQEMYMNMVFCSTPLTDDEGYRTRLPTTASLNSSFYSTDSSPMSSDELDALILSW